MNGLYKHTVAIVMLSRGKQFKNKETYIVRVQSVLK